MYLWNRILKVDHINEIISQAKAVYTNYMRFGKLNNNWKLNDFSEF